MIHYDLGKQVFRLTVLGPKFYKVEAFSDCSKANKVFTYDVC